MASAGDPIELHRSWPMRLLGGPALQPLFVVATVVLIIDGSYHGSVVAFVIAAVALAGAIVGWTAWVRVDGTGIHRRCYRPSTDLWSDITRVELNTTSLGVNSAMPMIRIHRGRRRHWLAPATGRSRHNEQFARALVDAARAHGVTATTSGWGGFED